MLFWILAALLTFGACVSVLLPFMRRTAEAAPDSAFDLMIYKDQLDELERDQSRNLIGRAEAEQARNEISRRILKADQTQDSGAGRTGSAGRWLAMAAVLSVPLVSWGVYAATGSPDQPSQPLQARMQQNPAESPVSELVARAEAHLQANPRDGNGWEVLAPIYVRVGRANDAVTAYRNAIEYLGPTAPRESGLGEAYVAVAGGAISPDAKAAFTRALAIAPTDGKARFYLALSAAQDGRFDEAKATWTAMQADLPDDSSWKNAATAALAQADKIQAEAAATGQPGPSTADIDNASDMTAEDRTAMIEGMVASLDAKLKDNPNDRAGWERLIRSYMVLNKPDQARDALQRGTAALGNTTREAAALQTFATSLNIPEVSQP
ncbi:c-type cytochrome biogenesis protein CcmI [Tianweitania sp. BSSL-BM11]|uniref:C-type cytochrome biogenesis protein CcmI n=1 Tax=Tianweitania aestuarii TaxID=2814886 RepID=A0ABS5RSF8_9HYPH|nr:c-type cytochrome biogenesis protein CcmI [Tianweitania aestuarii]MBS9719902.1 c-type cytochrome biogenesis protein CcmI [Tianweitania aestuarii]